VNNRNIYILIHYYIVINYPGDKMDIQIDQTTVDKIAAQLAKGAPDYIRAGYLTGKIEENRIFVDGVYVPEQQSDKIMTVIPPNELASAFQAIRANGKNIVGFVHYNGIFPAYKGAISNESRKMLRQKAGVPNLAVVVDSKGDYEVVR